MSENITVSVLGFNDSVHEVEIPFNQITFMLRYGSAVSTEETKEILALIRDYYNNFQFPEYEQTIHLWKYVFRDYTKNQIIWGLCQHVDKNAFPPKANELVEICEYRRKRHNEIFTWVCRCFRDIEEYAVRGGVDVTVSEKPSIMFADAEEIERARAAFFRRCYGFTSPDCVARDLSSTVLGHIIKAEQGGSLREIKPLHEIIENIELGS